MTPIDKRYLFILIPSIIMIFSIPVVLTLIRQSQDIREKAQVATKNGPDLDITYISRTPRYPHYRVDYPNGLPTATGNPNEKQWPDVGETVTYTAHIINKGIAVTPQVDAQWLVNGQVVKTDTISPLAPNEETTIILQNTFPQNPQTILFEVDPNNTATEISKANNTLTIGSHDLTIIYGVERKFYDIFNNTVNMKGTFSFEDWIEAHVAQM